jgi:tetratricopeptide (TPR) repeat protein
MLIYALALMTGALFLSLSRGGMLSFLLGLTLFGVLVHKHLEKSARRMVSGVVTAAMVSMILFLGTTARLERLATFTHDQNLTWGERLPVYQATWQMAQDFPLLGVGYEAFPVIFPRYQPAGVRLRYLQAHHDVLQLLAETGWVGFVVCISGVLLLIVDIVKQWRLRHNPFVQIMIPAGLAALAAMALHSLVDFNLRIPANAMLCVAVLALTVACAKQPGQHLNTNSHARTSASLLPVLIMAACLYLSYALLRIIMADFYYPQQQVLQHRHWVYQMDAAGKKRRLSQALRWTPNNPWYWRSLGDLEVNAAQQTVLAKLLTTNSRQQAAASLQRATVAYRRALQQSPTEPRGQLARLQVLYNLTRLGVVSATDTDEAIATLVPRIATLAPSAPFVQYGLGTLVLSRQHDKAVPVAPLALFRQALRLDLSYVPKVLQAYQRYLPAAQAVSRFVLAIPPTTQGHLQAARALQGQFWLQARRQYLAALTLDATNPNVLRAYGNALLQHQSFAAARALWERYRADHPDDPLAYQRLAEAYRGAVWQTLTTVRPQSVVGYVGLARLYASRQDRVAAIAMMQRVVGMAPGTIDHHLFLAQLYEQNGEQSKALEAYERLAALRPDNPTVFYELGEYWRRAGKPLRAIDSYRQAQRLDPQRALYFRQMGRTYAAHHDHRQAIAAYQRATALDGNDAVTYYELGRSHAVRGEKELARRAYGRAIELAPEHMAFRRALEEIATGEGVVP